MVVADDPDVRAVDARQAAVSEMPSLFGSPPFGMAIAWILKLFFVKAIESPEPEPANAGNIGPTVRRSSVRT